jgi:hypothetical protein
VAAPGVADEVHGHAFDDGHVFGSVAGSQAGQVVVEDEVEHPAVLEVMVTSAPLSSSRSRSHRHVKS